MNAIKTYGPLLLGLVALVLVILQQGRVSSLEAQLAATPAAAPSKASQAPATSAVGNRPAVKQLRARIAALEDQLNQTQTLAKKANAAAIAASVTGGDTTAAAEIADELAALRADVDDLMRGGALRNPEAQAALTAKMDERRQQQREQREERRKHQAQRRIDRFAQDHGLTEAQSLVLAEVASEQRDQRRAARAQVRSGERTRDDVRAELKTSNEARRARLGEFLNDEQLKAWQETSRGNRGQGRFGGGRGGIGGNTGG